jgi:hypothetical protein
MAMRAIEAKTFSGYGGLWQIELPKPQPVKDRVLVRVNAAGVTPLDHTILSGGHPRAKAPLVLGNEGAGVIEDAADSGLAAGSRVMFTGPYGVRENGAWQEWVLARPEDLALVPDAIDNVVAASLPVAYLTAQITLTLAGFKPGMTVLAPGIGGSVGNATYQLARAQGAGKVISTAGSAAKAARARELGFEDVIDLRGRSHRGYSPDNSRQWRRYRYREHRRRRDESGIEQPWSRRCADHVRLFRRTQNHDRCDRPNLETRADDWLLSVRSIARHRRRCMARHHPADRGRIGQADRRAGLSSRRGGRGLAPSD